MAKKEAGVEEDDVDSFLASLDPECEYCPPQLVQKLFESRAIGCITALLDRKVAHNQLDLRRRLANGQRPMCYAAKLGFHQGLQLFLRHRIHPTDNFLPDGSDSYSNIPKDEYGGEVIDLAFEASCEERKKKLGEEITLSQLILWLPEWISEPGNFAWWHTVKLLGRTCSINIESKAFEYAVNGQATQLLWLLLLVPDRILSPTFFRAIPMFKDRLELFSLRDFLTAQLAVVTADSLSIRHHDPSQMSNKSSSLELKRLILATSLRLLEVFHRAGPQLSYLVATLEKKHLSNIPIAQQVKTVLEGAGVPLTSLDCPIIAHPYHSEIKDYASASHKEAYLELVFLIRPVHVCRSEVLGSRFSRAIGKLCHHPYLKEWSPQNSVFKLLFIFCLPDLVEKMQCMLQLQLKHRNPAKVICPTYLAELCFIYMTEGRIVEFTAALMAVQILLRLDHPLIPQMSFHIVGNKKSPPTVYEYLLHQLKKVLDEEISLTGKSEDSVTVQLVKEKQSVISSALLLTKIFERSAQHINWYLHSARYEVIQERGDLKLIVDDVASFLEDSGFLLTSQDICVNHMECFSSKSSVSKTELKGDSWLFGPHMQRASYVKEKKATGVSKAIMSAENIKSSLLVGSSINKLSARSYHSFPMLRYGASKGVLVPTQDGVNLLTKGVESARWSDSILRKSSRCLTMTRRIILRL
ncbi:unnamed protein product [Linum tenue]|uniref:Uncharacterized protein n=2 Tax=Linum tenue TaxID=586396 RepID=A0AAV0N8Q4_9ROSI|nr:unnamed protein product [Linum tenue]